ncbi:LOW QUALITY PROTEIN: EF-hand calcium-binding domain-containing protein 6 [Sylvia borin]
MRNQPADPKGEEEEEEEEEEYLDDCLIHSTATSVSSVPDPKFFSWDIGQILLQNIVDKEDDLEKESISDLCSAYQDIEKAFGEIDVSQSGFVSLDYLKSVINGFIFPLPNEIFQELMNSKIKHVQGTIELIDPKWTGLYYHKFKDLFEEKEPMLWDNLKIAVLPGDLSGRSSHISKEIQQREEKRQTELSKHVLEDHGMPMDGSQFNLWLVDKLGLPDGELSYLDFVIKNPSKRANFAVGVGTDVLSTHGRLNGPGATLCNSSNHRANDAKYHCMAAEECLNHPNDMLMDVYGQEFCQLFHTQAAKEVLPWLLPSHETKQMIRDAELACDHAHYYLVIKARTRWYDLVRNFQGFDSEGNGIIQPRDLKKFLFPFGIPITLEGLKQLWARDKDKFQDFNSAFYKDKNRDGYVKICGVHRTLKEFKPYPHDFRSFLNNLGISIHDSRLSYFDFLRAIEDGRASEYQQKQKQAAPPASFAELSLEQTLIKIKEIVTSSDLLYKAFSLLEKDDHENSKMFIQDQHSCLERGMYRERMDYDQGQTIQRLTFLEMRRLSDLLEVE